MKNLIGGLAIAAAALSARSGPRPLPAAPHARSQPGQARRRAAEARLLASDEQRPRHGHGHSGRAVRPLHPGKRIDLAPTLVKPITFTGATNAAKAFDASRRRSSATATTPSSPFRRPITGGQRGHLHPADHQVLRQQGRDSDRLGRAGGSADRDPAAEQALCGSRRRLDLQRRRAGRGRSRRPVPRSKSSTWPPSRTWRPTSPRRPPSRRRPAGRSSR